MAGNGPPPKPPEQKKIEGTFRKDRDGGNASNQAPAGRPKCPPDLDGDARAIWRQLAPKLVRLKTIATVDGGVLEAYCRTLALARRLDKEAVKNPMVEDRFGGMAPNPAGIEARKLWPVVQSLASDLGLSYAARTKAPPPAQENRKDPAEAFLFGKKPPQRAEA